ncbi:MAG: hypothetical protein COA78_11335 [Blastopirellula sp.]|nr:MAG: hypothetical protein COA78_11335 [Blastopirellula sp.]
MTVEQKSYETTIETFEAAAKISRENARRKGNVVYLDSESADEVMITADLHGNRMNFNRILEIADLDQNPKRQLILQEVCHGGPTYPKSGGCMSHLMLEDVAALIVKYPEQVCFIISNHELAELCDFPISKGGRMLNLLFRCGLQEMYGEHTKEVHQGYLEFLRSLPIGVNVNQNTLVCHSLPKKCDEIPFDTTLLEREITFEDYETSGSLTRLVWGRDFRQENVDAFAEQIGVELFVTGHEPCREGFQSPNNRQVIIDCCCQMPMYMMLSLDQTLTHQTLLDNVHQLHSSSTHTDTCEA